MSLADEMEALLNLPETGVVEVSDFVLTNKDAILTALRGRDAVLEEAAKVAEGTVPECCGVPDHNPETGETYCCGNPSPRYLTTDETVAAIRALKEPA